MLPAMRWLLPTVNVVNAASAAVLLGSVHAASKRRWGRARMLSVGAGVGAVGAVLLAGGGVAYVVLAPQRAGAGLGEDSMKRATVLAARVSELMNCGALAVPVVAASAAVYGITTFAQRASRVGGVLRLLRR